MKKRAKKIGLLGGTFDPVHLGHLKTAHHVLNTFGLDEIIFVPCNIPAHKPDALISSSYDRFAMLSLATTNNSRFSVNPVELEREGISYTVDTIRYFTEKDDKSNFYFIMGMDSFIILPSWKEPEEIMSMCSLIIVNRPGYNVESAEVPEVAGRKLKNPPVTDGNYVYITTMEPCSISSTAIRKEYATNMKIADSVPEQVLKYIVKRNLYES